jgi:hypothetical protein
MSTAARDHVVSCVEPAFLKEAEAAAFLSVSPRLFRQLVEAGTVRVTQVRVPGHRRVCYSLDELRAVARVWVEESRPRPHESVA